MKIIGQYVLPHSSLGNYETKPQLDIATYVLEGLRNKWAVSADENAEQAEC